MSDTVPEIKKHQYSLVKLPEGELTAEQLDEILQKDIAVNHCLKQIARWQGKLRERRKKVRRIVMMKMASKAATAARAKFRIIAKKHGLTPK